ncbi:MAG: phosphate signaling complex protein PhoU [Wenzhouxiangellaceae bacterium]
MDTRSLSQHISHEYNQELEAVRSSLLAMGGLVEEQINHALQALVEGDSRLAEQVVQNDDRINQMEVAIDEECGRILARRQPAASDLRLVIAIIKASTDLERMGDEAQKIGRMALSLAGHDRPAGGYREIEHLGQAVQSTVRDALNTFARLEVESALTIIRADSRINREYESIARQCITFMMEDPRQIRRVLDAMWCARSLERIGDHAKNLCEYVIYLVHGKDVRHSNLDEAEKELRSR